MAGGFKLGEQKMLSSEHPHLVLDDVCRNQHANALQEVAQDVDESSPDVDVGPLAVAVAMRRPESVTMAVAAPHGAPAMQDESHAAGNNCHLDKTQTFKHKQV